MLKTVFRPMIVLLSSPKSSELVLMLVKKYSLF